MSAYKFPVIDVIEGVEITEDILDYLAREIVLAHGSPTMIKHECRRLIADVKNVKLNVVKDYIEQEILPSIDRPQARIGNFGEILAAIFLVESEGFWFPIYKLRYREKKDWSMRLTDLCLVKKVGVTKPLFCFGEVKTKSVSCNVKLGVEGHDSLAKDNALEDPEVLRFLCTQLYEMGKLDEAFFLSEIRLDLTPYDTRHDLFLIHNKEDWREEILEKLANHGLNKNLIDFSVKVILISQLKNVIDKAYARAWLAAEVMINE